MTQEQWLAISNRDPEYDGVFCYGLKSSKTICRPSCTAHKISTRNVVVFNTLEEGIKAGYHPCSRCRPDLPGWHGTGSDIADRASRYIEDHYTDKFSLDSIADALFINKIYLSKIFKKVTGSTLLSYHNEVRCRHAAELLCSTDLKIEIIGSMTGFATPSHFARIFRSVKGCSPKEFRNAYLSSLQEDADIDT